MTPNSTHNAALTRPLSLLDRSLARLSGASTEPITLERMRWFWLDSLFANISIGFFSGYIGLFLLTYGASNAQVGQLTAFASLLGLLALFPGARSIPFFGKRKWVVVLFGGGLARIPLLFLAVLPLLIHSPALAILLAIALNGLISFSNNFGAPAWTSLASDIVPARVRGSFFAHRGQAINVATLTTAPIAGWLIRTFGGLTGDPFAGYQIAFALAFLLGMVATYSYAHIDEPAAPAAAATAPRSLAANLQAMRRRPLFLGFVAATLLWNLGLQISLPFFNVYLAGPLGASTTTVGLVNAAMPLTALFTQRWMGRQINRRGNIWVAAICGLPIPLFPVMWMFVTAPWQVVPINLLAGFVWTGFNLAMFNLLLELSPEEARAESAAFYQFVIAFAMIIGPLVGGYLADAFGYKATFAASAIGRSLGALSFLWWVAWPALWRKRKGSR